jgi:hypothetical protein
MPVHPECDCPTCGSAQLRATALASAAVMVVVVAVLVLALTLGGGHAKATPVSTAVNAGPTATTVDTPPMTDPSLPDGAGVAGAAYCAYNPCPDGPPYTVADNMPDQNEMTNTPGE